MRNYLRKICLVFVLPLIFCGKILAQSVADVPIKGSVFYIEDGNKEIGKTSHRKAAASESYWETTSIIEKCFDESKIGKSAWLLTADGETKLAVSLAYSGDDERYIIESQEVAFYFYNGNDLFHDENKQLITEPEKYVGTYTKENTEKKATIHITAPKMFPEPTIPYYTFYAVITVKFKHGGTASVAQNLGISRNGLFLLHGLNSNGSCFVPFYNYLLYSAGSYIPLQIQLQDYSGSNTSSFYDNTHENQVVKRGLQELSNKLFDIGIASTKYDMIGHSMGGILERLYNQEIDNKHTNKLITLNTPHFGSKLGDAYLGYEVVQVIPAVRDNSVVQKINEELDKAFKDDASRQAIIDLGTSSAAIQSLAFRASQLNGIRVCAVGTEIDWVNYEGIKYAVAEPFYQAYGFMAEHLFDKEVKHERNYLDENADGTDAVVTVESQKGGCEKTYIYKGTWGQAMHCKCTEWSVVHDQLNHLLTSALTYEFSLNGFGAPPTSESKARKAPNENDKYVTEFEDPKPTSFIKIEAVESDDENYTHELKLTHSNDMMTTFAFSLLSKDDLIADYDKDVMYFDMRGFEGEKTIYAIGRTDYNALVIDSVKVKLGDADGIRYLKDTFEPQYSVKGNDLRIENVSGSYSLIIYNYAGQVLAEMNSNPSHTYALPRNNNLLIIGVRTNKGQKFIKVMTKPNK